MFTPVIVWNAQHDWASFRFQFMDRFEGHSFDIRYVGTFLVYQLAAATPMLLIGFAAVVWWSMRTRRRLFRPRTIVALAFGLPLLAVMAYKSLRYDIHINWTLPAFLSLFPAFAHWFLVRLRHRRGDVERQKWSRQLTWTAAVCLAINLGLLIFLLTFQPRLRLLTAFGPWDDLAIAVERQEDALENATGREVLVIVDGPYRLPSIVAFYRKRHANSADAATEATQRTTSEWIVGGRRHGYAYWLDANQWAGRDCIYVFENDKKDRLGEVRDRFDSVQLIEEVDLGRGRKSKGKYGIAVCKGLRL
jgi:dolichol-phosphate mannosyltransferase